jgi:hypothetical protein
MEILKNYYFRYQRKLNYTQRKTTGKKTANSHMHHICICDANDGDTDDDDTFEFQCTLDDWSCFGHVFIVRHTLMGVQHVYRYNIFIPI